MRIITLLYRPQGRMEVHMRNFHAGEVKNLSAALKRCLQGGSPQEMMLLDRIVRPDPQIDEPAHCRVERLLLDTDSIPGTLRMLGFPAPGILALLFLILKFLAEEEIQEEGAAHEIIGDDGPRGRSPRALAVLRDDARRYVRATLEIRPAFDSREVV